MPEYGTWLPYTGSDSVILALVLLLIGAVLAFWGMRLRHPLAGRHPGRFAAFAGVAPISTQTRGRNDSIWNTRSL